MDPNRPGSDLSGPAVIGHDHAKGGNQAVFECECGGY